MFCKTISKTFKNKKDETLKITILDAKYSNNKEEEILLDEPIVDNMLDSIFKSVINNTSKYNKMPKSILISQDTELLEEIRSK